MPIEPAHYRFERSQFPATADALCPRLVRQILNKGRGRQRMHPHNWNAATGSLGRWLITLVVMLSVTLGLAACGAGQPGTQQSGPSTARASKTPTPLPHSTGKITEFPIPAPADGASAIAAGSDGNLWFTSSINGNLDTYGKGIIERMTRQGVMTAFTVPSMHDVPPDITAGPDGNLWYTGGGIGRITPAGQMTNFPLPHDPFSPISRPLSITSGPDGNLWFTDSPVAAGVGGWIGQITPQGQITLFPLPSNGNPNFITAGPDGNLWFTETRNGEIGRITPNGQVTEYPLPANSDPTFITAGPDHNLWFTESIGDRIGRITPAGQVMEFPLPTSSNPNWITTGPDGNLWFTELASNRIGRITPAGQVTELPLLGANRFPVGVTRGPDGNLWFVEDDYSSGRGWIARLDFGW